MKLSDIQVNLSDLEISKLSNDILERDTTKEVLGILKDYTAESHDVSESTAQSAEMVTRAFEALSVFDMLKIEDVKIAFLALFNLGYEAGSLAQPANELKWANSIVGLNPWIQDHLYDDYMCRYCEQEESRGHAEDCLYLEAESFIESFGVGR